MARLCSALYLVSMARKGTHGYGEVGAGRGFAEIRRLEPIFLRFWKRLSDLNRPNPPSPVFCFIDTEGGT